MSPLLAAVIAGILTFLAIFLGFLLKHIRNHSVPRAHGGLRQARLTTKRIAALRAHILRSRPDRDPLFLWGASDTEIDTYLAHVDELGRELGFAAQLVQVDRWHFLVFEYRDAA